jgi:steroid 5-alpha reductase family enzyme
VGRNEAIFVGAIVVAGGLLLAGGRIFAVGLIAALASFIVLWLASLALRDASIVDIFWGPACAGLGWLYHLLATPRQGIGLLVCALTTMWGVRLAAHIAARNAGSGEDYRYRQWRERSGPAFWWVSLFKVFLLQAVVLWVVSSPLELAQRSGGGGPVSRWLIAAGVLLWLFGFAFEAVSDWQLLAFARDPANRGRVLDSGPWGLSRHPNYFGEAVLWWGIGVIAMSVAGPLALAGPAVLTFTLVKISGVAMLDRELVERRQGYSEYIESTPAFVPIPRALRRRRRHRV